MKVKLVLTTWIIILNGCVDISTTHIVHIDIDKTEVELIPKLNSVEFKKIEIANSLLIVNDTLIKFESDTTDNPQRWIETSMEAENWGKRKSIGSSELQDLKKLISETGNYRIIKEQNAYFFSEGGWIDSNFGVLYSKTNPKEKIEEFKFDRVQTIDPIEDRENWYSYYAD